MLRTIWELRAIWKLVSKLLRPLQSMGKLLFLTCLNLLWRSFLGLLVTMDRPCKDNKNDSSDNIWQQFPFANYCLADDKTIRSETQSNSDLDTSSPTDNWKVFSKRGLHLIHLNISVSCPKLMNSALLLRSQGPV